MTAGGGTSARAQLGGLYAALATGCGWRFGDIDALTLAEAAEVFAYWEHNPPAHLLLQTIARLLGWQPQRAAAGDASALHALAAAPPPGLAVRRGGGDPGLPVPLFDAAALAARNRAHALALARRNRGD